MSSQVIHDIVLGMRKAVKRAEEGSDSDEPVDMVSNRGNKLRKRAKYIHEGQLAPPTRYRLNEEIIYGEGCYKRNIISHIPKVYDDDGYEIDLDDEDERHEAAIAEATEAYPYSDVRIEELLAPLTAASDLPIHPTMSTPFTSKILTQLTEDAYNMLRKERASLWKMKHLLTKLGGDHTWAPTGLFELEDDIELFTEGQTLFQYDLSQAKPIIDGDEEDRLTADDEMNDIPAIEVVEAIEEASADNRSIGQSQTDTPTTETNDATERLPGTSAAQSSIPADVAMTDAPNIATPVTGLAAEIPHTANVIEEQLVTDEKPVDQPMVEVKDDTEPDPDETLVDDSTILEEDQHEGGAALTNGHSEGEEGNPDDAEGEGQDGEDEIPEPRRMRTRAQAQAASDESNPSRTRSTSPDSSSYIDPYFLAPMSSIPDRNVGMPSAEAEDVRRILQLFIQKQEEVCRGADRVYNGLLKAERMRKTVFRWAKAEGHTGELSDGEDWYDEEEWNLSEPLKKGQDEEEEDAATTAKKTRTRRQ